MILTVASYNIHKAEGIDRRVDLSRIALVLKEIDADLVGVQEVYRPQAEALAGSLGMPMVMGATRIHAGLPYGNAVFTLVAGRMLHLFNVHFGLKIRERVEQVEALVREQILNVELVGPRVLMGDLNEWFPGPVGRALRRELHGPRIRRTHPSPLPLFPLDRIYWDRDLHSVGFHVHRSRL